MGSVFPRAGLLQWLAWVHRSWTWFQTASRPWVTHAHQIPGPCPWLSRLISPFSVWIVVETASRIQYTFQIAPRASSIFGHSLLSSRLGWPEWLVPSVQRGAWASEHSYIKIISWAIWVYKNRLSLSLWSQSPPFPPSFIPCRPCWTPWVLQSKHGPTSGLLQAFFSRWNGSRLSHMAGSRISLSSFLGYSLTEVSLNHPL